MQTQYLSYSQLFLLTSSELPFEEGSDATWVGPVSFCCGREQMLTIFGVAAHPLHPDDIMIEPGIHVLSGADGHRGPRLHVRREEHASTAKRKRCFALETSCAMVGARPSQQGQTIDFRRLRQGSVSRLCRRAVQAYPSVV